MSEKKAANLSGKVSPPASGNPAKKKAPAKGKESPKASTEKSAEKKSSPKKAPAAKGKESPKASTEKSAEKKSSPKKAPAAKGKESPKASSEKSAEKKSSSAQKPASPKKVPAAKGEVPAATDAKPATKASSPSGKTHSKKSDKSDNSPVKPAADKENISLTADKKEKKPSGKKTSSAKATESDKKGKEPTTLRDTADVSLPHQVLLGQDVAMGTITTGGSLKLEEVIAKNQEAAAALAVLIERQQEDDRNKIKVLDEKTAEIKKLLVEREDEYRVKNEERETQLVAVSTSVGKLSRENEILKEVLSDRDGPKIILKLEQLEEENAKLRQDVNKWKQIAEYHKSAHLRAMESVERLKEGLPVGPTPQEMERAQEQVSRLAKENTTLTFKVSELEMRMSTMEGGNSNRINHNAAAPFNEGGETFRYQQQPPPEQQQHQQQSNQLQIMEFDSSADQQKGTADTNASYNFGKLPQYTSYFKSDGGLNNSSLMQQQPLLPSMSPMNINNSKFGAFASSPVRGVVSPSLASNPQLAGFRGWRALLLPNGNVVYHNMITNRSQWDIPPELASVLTNPPQASYY